MAFQLQGGNAANQDYDYQSGSGMDNFMSRAIDEVSWQSSGLGTSYNTLSQSSIGQSAYTYASTATPTNFDTTSVSGSLGGTISVGGGSTNGSGGGSAGNVVIDGINGAISILDSSGNTVGIIGNLNG
jgi:hypothetical protein